MIVLLDSIENLSLNASHREYVVGCLYDEEGKEHAAQQCKCRKGVSPYAKMCFLTTGVP